MCMVEVSELGECTLLVDLEGTIYTREGVIEGAAKAVRELRRLGVSIRFLTNNDSESGEMITQRLATHGVDATVDDVFTPVHATCAYLAHKPNARVYLLTTPDIASELGHEAVLVDAHEHPTHVVVGDMRSQWSPIQLNGALAALRGGAELVALQKGRCYMSGGAVHMDTGAFVAALEYAAGVEAVVLGKPHRRFVDLACATVPESARRLVLVVGDDITTDIAMGKAAQVGTIQVKTGKWFAQQGLVHMGEPDAVIESVAELPTFLVRFLSYG